MSVPTRPHRKTLMFYCQHVAGIGHLTRSLALAEGLTSDFRIVFLSGGPMPDCIDVAPEIEMIELPPLTLVDDALKSVEDEDLSQVKQRRRDLLLQLLADLKPEILLVELFPFGRMQFTFELKPLIEFVDQMGTDRPLLLCSLRDIVVAPQSSRSLFWKRAHALLNRYFDGVLRHGDSRYHHSAHEALEIPVYHTGYVNPHKDTVYRRPQTERVVVSAGGGRVGAPLLAAAAKAFTNPGIGTGREMTLITGPFIPGMDRLLLRNYSATPGLTIKTWVEGREFLSEATVSVSQGGYNTTVDLLDWGGPALIVPYSQEQEERTDWLAEMNKVRVLPSHQLTAETLAQQIRTLFSFRPDSTQLEMNGIHQTREILLQLCTDRREVRTRPRTNPTRSISIQSRTRVCFVSLEYPPDPGGVGRSAKRITQHLSEAGFDIHVFTLSKLPEGTVTTTEENGIHVNRVAEGPNMVASGRLLYEAVYTADLQFNFDLFHGFFLPLGNVCHSIADDGNRPLIASIRGSDATKWLEEARLIPTAEAVLRRADWVTSVASDLLEKASKRCSLEGRSSVIFNSIENQGIPRWSPSHQNQGVVGTVAEFRPKKNLPMLIEAYASVSLKQRQHLKLAGYFPNESEKDKCWTAIQKLNLEEEVIYTGAITRSELFSHLLSMRVFVISSRDDGLPNTLLEAVATGLPVVSTRVGGMRDLLIDGENALLVAPNDPTGMARAIEKVLKDEDLAKTLSAGARKVIERCSPEQEKEAWVTLYEKMLSTRQASHESSSSSERSPQVTKISSSIAEKTTP